MPQFEITSGQSILKEEVDKTIQSMKKGKATQVQMRYQQKC